MTYAVLEPSQDRGKPVELYRFTIAPAAVDDSMPAAPAAPGQLVLSGLVPVANWTLVRDLGQTSLSDTYPPTSPDSYFLDGGTYLEVWGAYHGGIGGGNAFIYAEGTVEFLLEPNKTYTVRLLGADTLTFEPIGARIAAPYGDGNAFAFDSTSLVYKDRQFTTDAFGTFKVQIGHFGMNVGDAEIVVLYGMWVYDQSIEATPGDESTDGFTFPVTELNYTSADETVVYQGSTYVPSLIVRDVNRVANDGLAKAELRVSMDRTHPVAQYVNTQSLSVAPIACEVYRGHRDDMTSSTLTSAATNFVGHVLRAEFEGEKIVLVLAPTERYVERRVPRTLIQPQCNNFLYDDICAVNPLRFLFSGTVATIADSGLTLTIAGLEAFAAGDTSYFQFGVVVMTNGRRGFITSQFGDTVTLWKPMPELGVGSTVQVLAGCDRTTVVCKNRFDNLARRRGFEILPIRNPFTGGGLS